MNFLKLSHLLNPLKINALSSSLPATKKISTTVMSNFYLNSLKLNAKASQLASTTKLPFSDADDKSNNERAENISRAMSYYLEKMAERESLMKFKTEEFEIGKRHLAKMMGENAETFTQDDINRSIEYLLPSGLFNKKARPFLKHPEDYYPKSKLAAFGSDGRPLHHLFYTGNPDFYQIIYELTQKYLNLNRLEDAMNLIKGRMKTIHKTDEADLNTRINLTGSVWIDRNKLNVKFNMKIDELSYNKFIIMLQKLAEHSLSKREETFIGQFIVPFEPPIKLSDIPALLKDETGRPYQELEVRQRTAIVKLKLYEGNGKIKIKAPEGNFNINFFDSLTQREQLLFPFKVVDKINKFDIEMEVNNGGMSCLSKAARYAISKALCCFVSADSIEKLRLAGLLTSDSRPKERKKPGQEGARRRYTWKKR
ncbi:unnamed protein product [Brachionus calyciflorus]|uniref:Mitochondrial ribosomal protein S9 n=1 Tax=Brachionus calyciflorus TaxID=104777 RepID=A0A813LYA7_9BILA|nr:unnamed protein product [Brachionus calyciflorus]